MAINTGTLKCPTAVWKPYTVQRSTTKLVHDIVCVHTMVGTFNGSYSWANQSGHPYWHFGLNAQGTMHQCWGLEYRTAANLEGNWHVIPIETSDRNEGVWPTEWAPRPWTTAQKDKLVTTIAWLCKRFSIPASLIPDSCAGRRGLAYHRQGIPGWPEYKSGCEKWSSSVGKTCPTDPRKAQFINEIVPRVKALVTPPPPPPGDWLDMVTKAEFEAAMKTYTSAWLVRPKDSSGHIMSNVFIVSHDFSSKFWIGDWAVVKVLDFVENLNDAGTDPATGNPKPHNFDWRFIQQIPEEWNPALGYSFAPLPEAERWKNTPSPDVVAAKQETPTPPPAPTPNP